MKVVIIGSGNVAYHLEKALANNVEVHSTSSRTFDNLVQADIYIICVSDSAISEVADNLKVRLDMLHIDHSSYIVAHTSGATPRSVLDDKFRNTGVLYPLQTFSRNKELNYCEIPFFIDSNDTISKEMLWKLATSVSSKVRYADCKMLTKLHIAGVMSCNFINHLWALSDKFLADNNLDFNILHPLITETCDKISKLSPLQAQTGPAVRNDYTTIEKHKTVLKDTPELLNIYSILTESIIKNSRDSGK